MGNKDAEKAFMTMYHLQVVTLEQLNFIVEFLNLANPLVLNEENLERLELNKTYAENLREKIVKSIADLENM